MRSGRRHAFDRERVRTPMAAFSLLGTPTGLDIPQDVMIAVNEAADYAERLAEDRTPDRIEEWSPIRQQLFEASQLL
jgi:hypothetical protein